MARWEITYETNSLNEYSDINNLKSDLPVPYPGYAHCLPRYSKLNGSFFNVSTIDAGNIGYMSADLSDENGDFAEAPVITVEFAKKKTSDGFHMIFNELSGDYCNHLEIKWYKYEKLVHTQEFYPDCADYMCSAKVGMYNKAVITFLSTNHPYRYLWLAKLENFHLTEGEGLRIIYNDVAYLGKEHTTIYTEDAAECSNVNRLLEETAFQFPAYATALPDYSKLDGTFINAPDNPENLGFYSSQISGESGYFVSPPTIEFHISEAITSMGIELNQNSANGDFCDVVDIEWYLEGDLVSEKTFQPDAVDYVCENLVESYDKVIISFIHTNKPYRHAILSGFQYGAIRVFTNKDVISCTVFDEISVLGDYLPISTLDFTVRNTSLLMDFERSQKIYVYFDLQIIGQFYLKSASRKTEFTYQIKAEDIISFLEANHHYGGFYNDVPLEDIVAELFDGIDITVELDDSVAGETITGWLPYDTCKNNLAQVCFAIGAIVDTSFETKVYIFKANTETDPVYITDDMIYANSVNADQNDIYTGVSLVSHNWVENTEDDPREIYKGVLTETVLVVFNDPQFDLSIENGTIESYGDNYAYISGDGENETVLSGRQYDHQKTVITREKPYIYRNKKFASVESATLVTAVNKTEVLNRVYEYYIHNQSLKVSVLLDDVQLSDIVSFLVYGEERQGMVQSLNLKFYGEIKAEAKVKCLT
ncbi:MAG: hypothetical protein IKE28_11860 [Solobacterium sp.]|nr:hypothetical protein [Solobacterium sp.]